MKNEPLTGYLLHARPYQETRAIYYLFSQEHGVVHGVGKRGLPEFAKLSLFATGKGGLKNFKDVSIVSAIYPKRHYYYALLYLNEVLYRLLVPENPCPGLWQVYQDSLEQIDQLTGGGDDMSLRLILRNFERALFVELGVELDFDEDHLGQDIRADGYYKFVPNVGFVASAGTGIVQDSTSSQSLYWGQDLQLMATAKQNPQIYGDKVKQFSQLQRTLLDFLLDYRPLNSRKLWQQRFMS